VSSPLAYSFDRQRIVVADKDSITSALVIGALRRDGHCVALEPEALSDTDAFSLVRCHLLISTLRIEGLLRGDLLQELRQRFPALPVLYLADASPSAADLRGELPLDLPTLRGHFTMEQLQVAVRSLLPQLRLSTTLARVVEPTTFVS
jgi:DNA-binding NtrC family response regulator